ncbi:MAG: c-type cytochrome [Myxococcales bacterium]|nr:c-type cytochrome [Myxococcales bacterium]
MGDAARGRELATKHECHRCHGGLELPPIAATSHCVRCHIDVLAGKFDHKTEALGWRKNVAHLIAVPSLAATGARLDYAWLVRYLADPRDLRPALEPTMPRLGLDAQASRDIAAYLVSVGKTAATSPTTEHDALSGADDARGRKLIDEFQCGACHRMSGVDELAATSKLEPGKRETRAAVMLAPDLRFARERMGNAELVRWLLDPAAVKPDTLMPRTPMTPEQARDIAGYLMRATLAPQAVVAVPEALPLLERKVSFDEVKARVLDVTCRHCHGDPNAAFGDGGPGNTGGFGFPARGVNLTSYEQLMAGYLDSAGERKSLFAKMADGTPRIVAALWARHRELAGAPNPELRGMPLGLPPVPPADIQLFATWVAQGRPR